MIIIVHITLGTHTATYSLRCVSVDWRRPRLVQDTWTRLDVLDRESIVNQLQHTVLNAVALRLWIYCCPRKVLDAV